MVATLSNTATGVTNGLFIVPLDFGGGVFNGDSRWLEIAVRTNGGGAFIPLSPRQSVAPASIDRPKLRTRCASCGVMQVLPPAIGGSFLLLTCPDLHLEPEFEGTSWNSTRPAAMNRMESGGIAQSPHRPAKQSIRSDGANRGVRSVNQVSHFHSPASIQTQAKSKSS